MRTASPGLAFGLLLALVVAGCASPRPAGGDEDGTPGGEAEPDAGAADPTGATDGGSEGSATAAPAPATDPAAQPPPPPPAAGTTSEPLGGAPEPGNSVHTLEVGGRQRTYILHVPPGLPAGQPVPLLVMLHPAMTSGSQVQYFYGLDAQADQRGFIVAYPDGTPEDDPTQHTWNAGYCCGAGRDTGSQDVEFIAALIAHLLAEYPVDPGHVGLAGHSNGGMLAHRVAAAHTDLVSSIVVVAGSIGGQTDRFQPIDRVWTPSRSLDVLIVHATDDSVIAYEGGNPPGPFEPARIDLSVHEAVDLWKDANGLPGDGTVTTSGVVVTRSWTGTPDGELVFITTEGGHGWPGVPGGQPPFFRTPAEPAATPLVADFFMAHSR